MNKTILYHLGLSADCFWFSFDIIKHLGEAIISFQLIRKNLLCTSLYVDIFLKIKIYFGRVLYFQHS